MHRGCVTLTLMKTAPTTDGKHWILWDGDCGFCRRTVNWVNRRDRKGLFHSMPYQQAPSPPMTPEFAAACERAVHLITPQGRMLRAGRAALYILERLGWGPVARLLALPPFVWGVEAVYWLVARNRALVSRFLFTRE